MKFGYATLGNIACLNHNTVKDAKGCGLVVLKEIEDKLSKAGLKLSTTEAPKPPLKFIPAIAPPNASIEINAIGGKQSKLEYRCDLLPPQALLAVSDVLKTGAERYGEGNWRLVPVKEHINHALVHLLAHLSGDGCDDHLCHAATRLLFALDMKLEDEHKLGADD